MQDGDFLRGHLVCSFVEEAFYQNEFIVDGF
ncbi:hypothetical protein AX13_17490 [Comamonas aquatica DA1877]|uniref:Uncharacterized protein n=1 Tax=Comamonas aquatica DA1877 TaxID=1457173 RepID=A0A014MF89_9BURK|nr:hypothetical protein AX13_17490 [Comamonas aquatica DA1877]